MITHKDVKGKNRIFSPAKSPYNRCDSWDRPILNDDKVYMYGDVLAMVAADTEKNARAAAEKVKVELEQLPEYLDALDAIADDAIEVHPGTPNIYVENPIFKGEDTKDVFANAPYVVEGSFYTQRQPHAVLEPDVGLAYTDEEGRVTVHTKTLALQATKFMTAAGVGLEPDQIRVIENPTGASFGYTLSPQTAALLMVATMATGRPVCARLDYPEHTHYTGKRSVSYSNVKMAADKDGKEALRCIQCECMACVKACNFLRFYNEYPKQYVKHISKSLNVVPTLGTRFASRMINSCSLCGLCKEKCPTDFV